MKFEKHYIPVNSIPCCAGYIKQGHILISRKVLQTEHRSSWFGSKSSEARIINIFIEIVKPNY